MPDSQYLSIGEVLGLLLEDFPDVTISKIRFLESQGLIEPERTPSGYRKFYDHDVDLLRAILHEQRENFLPLKVIRDRITSGSFEADPTGGRTPPRGIRNVDVRSDPGPELPAVTLGEHRDSVFRRTDGGPEWADGRALIPGAQQPPPGAEAAPAHAPTALADAPDVAALLDAPAVLAPAAGAPAVVAPAVGAPAVGAPAVGAPGVVAPARPAPAATPATERGVVAAPTAVAPGAPSPEPASERAAERAPTTSTVTATGEPDPTMPYSRDEFCVAAEITSAQLDELESYGLVTPRGTGRDAAYPPETLEIARISGRFLANGIDARHLRSWRQSADREAALFEQRIMPLLRQRNPASRQRARDTLGELAGLGARLHDALIEASLRHHFDNG